MTAVFWAVWVLGWLLVAWWCLRAAHDWLGQPLADVPDRHRAALPGCQWPDREQVVAR